MLKKYGILVMLTALAFPVYAGPSSLGAAKLVEEQLDHSGGCRKDSPYGMCCHAGSKPYHCH